MQRKSTPSTFVCPLLFTEQPVVINIPLATLIGLEQAIILSQVHYWTNHYSLKNDTAHFYEGRYWTYNSVAKWQQALPFMRYSKVKRTISSLVNPHTSHEGFPSRGALLFHRQLAGKLRNKATDRSNWYAVNHLELESLRLANPLVQNEPIDWFKMNRSPSETSPEIGDYVGGSAGAHSADEVDCFAGGNQTIRCRHPSLGSLALTLNLRDPLHHYLGRQPSPSQIQTLAIEVRSEWKINGHAYSQEELWRAAEEAKRFNAHWTRKGARPSVRPFITAMGKVLRE